VRPLFVALPGLIAFGLVAQEAVDRAGDPMPEPPKGELFMRGTVVDEITRAPLRRAMIHASCMNGEFAALSDASGGFEIAGLRAGSCEINAEKPGYITQSEMGPIQLERSRSDVVVTMAPGAMVTGRVVDNAGDPVANAWVQAFQSHVLLGKRRMQLRNGAYTNDLGRYRITGLDPGPWLLRAVCNIPQVKQQAGLGTSTPLPGVAWPPVYFGGATSEKTAVPVKLSAAGTFEADFAVTLESGYSITGKLEGFKPNQETEVQLLRTSDNDNVASAAYNVLTGRFSIHDVPAGSYYLRVTSGSESNRLRAFQAVDVNGDIRNLVLPLLPGTDIEGELQGTLKTDPNRQLRANRSCTLSLRPETFDHDHTNTYTARAEPGKEFAFEHVLPDRYHLDVRCMQGGWVRSATYGDADVLRHSMTVGAGGLSLKVELGEGSGEVSGTVRNASGEPVAGVVILIPEDGGPALRSPAIPRLGFAFPYVPPGRYRAYAWRAQMQPEYEDPDYVRKYSDHGRDVSVDAGGKATVDVELIEESK
jgi:hypothetical protein